METFFQHAVNGLAAASVYALIAVGVTAIFGLTGIVNFAHGEFLTFGGLITATMVDDVGQPYAVALLVATLTMGVAGFGAERLLFGRTLERPVTGFILSLALIIIFQHVAIKIWGTNEQSIPPPIAGVVDIGGVRIAASRLLVVAASALVLLFFFYLLARTKWGKALNASSGDRDTAALMGIPVRRYVTGLFTLGSATAGLGGGLLIALAPIGPFTGTGLVVKGFAVALIGGLGSVSGAVLGALVLGLVESFSAGYLSAEWVNAYAFVMMILVLLIRPSGIIRGAGV